MKKTLISTFLLMIFAFCPPPPPTAVTANSVLYASYVGMVRDNALLNNGKVLYVNENGPVYLAVGTNCPTGAMIIPTTSNWDQTNSILKCLFHITKQTTGTIKKITANVKSLTGKNVLFVNYDPATNVATADDQFFMTGSNQNVGVKFNATQIATDVIRVWNETATQTEINSSTIPAYGVADLNLTASTVTVRNDLVLWEGAGRTLTRAVYKLSNGKIVHTGFGTMRMIIAGPSAKHGFIEDPATSTITDLNFPGSGLTSVDGVVEKNGVAYLVHSFSAPAAPLTPTLVAMDINTFALSGTNCPFTMTPSGVEVVNDRIVPFGSPKPTGNTLPMAAYNPTTGIWENWSGNLFTNPGPSSNIVCIANLPCSTGCQYPLSVSGNFETGKGGDYESPFVHIAKSCYIGSSLPLHLLSFAAQMQNDKSSLLIWEMADAENGSNFEVEKSTNGTTFNSIGSVSGDGFKKIFTFVDRSLVIGNTYYKIKITDMNGKVTYSLTIKLVSSNNVSMSVYPNPVKAPSLINISSNITVDSWILVDISGKELAASKKPFTGTSSITTPIMKGIYILKVKTGEVISPFKIVVQ